MIEPMGQQIYGRGDYRIIRRNGAVIPFEPRKISKSMTKAFLAENGGSRKPSESIRAGSTAADAGAGATGAVASSSTDGGSSGGGGGGDGGDGCGDGDGDGDGDGPRRRPTPLIPSCQFAVPTRFRQRVIASPPIDRSLPHRRALITLFCLTTSLLTASITFALLGYPELADKTLLALGSVPLLALRLVKPK